LFSLNHIRIVYGSAIFFAVVSLLLIREGFDWILLTPAALLVVFLALFRLDQLIFLTVFLTPLSINFEQTPLGFGISLPGEPLIFGLMLITFIKILHEGGFDRRIVSYPVSLLILFHLFWFLFTTATSTMFIVSLKYSLARIWFVVAFYFLATKLFVNIKNISVFIWSYTIPLLVVIVYTTLRHAAAGFTEKAAHVAMTPFYNDHTAYAAVLALFLPVLLSFCFLPGKSILFRLFSIIASLTLVMAIVLSYTRAAWVGILIAFLAFLVFLLKINYKIVVTGILACLIVLAFSWTRIMIKLESNRKQSSTEYSAHLQSISNISTDASNVERINRWSSAWRMFMDKPLAGWGPGTYQFKYAPYQQSNEKTIISTNAGDRGNAHSEYIGPLAEQGLFGFLAIFLVSLMVILKSSDMIRNTTDRTVKTLGIGLLLGLITYWVHGLLNDFLDTDKASVPFWGFIAALTALDMYHSSRKTVAGNSSPD